MVDGKRKKGGQYNATTHGIFAGILLREEFLGESEKAYLMLLSGLRKAIMPEDQFVEMQVDNLAFLYLRLSRAYVADWKAAPKLFEKVVDALDEEAPLTETVCVDKENEVVVIRKRPRPDLVVRY